MSDIEPTGYELAVRGDELVLRDESMRALRSVLLQLDDRRAQLVEEGNLAALAAGGQDLQTLMFDLRSIERQTRLDIADMIDDRCGGAFGTNRIEIEGVGAVESRGGWSRKGWRSEELLWRVIERAINSVESENIVNTDGEVIPVLESLTAEALYDALVTVLPMTSSLSWRTGQKKPDGTTTGLKALGFDDADWCSKEEQPRLANIPKRGTP